MRVMCEGWVGGNGDIKGRVGRNNETCEGDLWS